MSIKWIKKGRQLGQAVKNVQRLRQVLSVLGKHGFEDIVFRMNLSKFLPKRRELPEIKESERTTQERLRLAFEELGPTFVKLGQLLSTRPDLMPEPFIDEFVRLQDDVLPLPFETVKAVIERELEKDISEAFAYFDEKPLASASIGQVHVATLLSGEKVVVKVQRPEIKKLIETDISLLAFLAGLLERYIPETRIIGPRTVVDEFFRTLSYELDFVVEANNMSKIKENLAEIQDIVIPRVFKAHSTHKILTLERLEGVRVNDIKALETLGIDKKKIVSVGAKAFFKAVMVDGIFHGDLHGGNLFVLPGDRLGIIDFGIVGRLSQRSRDQLANMVMALLTEDYETLCYEYAELGAAETSIDFEKFQREVRNTLSPYMGLALSDLNLGKILIEATKIATRYRIKIPGDWMIVFKAILTMEGMGRTLDPEFDLLAVGQDLIKDLVKDQYSVQRITKELLWVVKDSADLLKILPRQIRWMFRKFTRNDFAFEIKIPELKGIKAQLDDNGRRMSLSILASGLFISSSIALQHKTDQMFGEYPVSAVFFLVLGLLFLIGILFRSIQK